jgi:uncharacterized membrane protein YozB (DUF420 family)
VLPRRDDIGEGFAALRRHRTATRFSSIVYLCVCGGGCVVYACVCVLGRKKGQASSGVK